MPNRAAAGEIAVASQNGTATQTAGFGLPVLKWFRGWTSVILARLLNLLAGPVR